MIFAMQIVRQSFLAHIYFYQAGTAGFWSFSIQMSYSIGVGLAISAGVADNIGWLMQKKVVNDVPPEKRDSKYIQTLARNPVWLTGLVIQLAGVAALFVIAVLFIGPALVPGLMAVGLIILALGSVKLIGEHLRFLDIIGIGLMVAAAFAIGMSGMAINVTAYNMVDPNFLGRSAIYTIGLFGIICILDIIRRKVEKARGIAFALNSGLLFSIANFWTGPMLGMVIDIINNTSSPFEVAIFAIVGILATVTNIGGIVAIQHGFKTGNASLLVPIQYVPAQITPAIMYLSVFSLTPPSTLALALFIAGISLIIASSFILTRRQVLLEKSE